MICRVCDNAAGNRCYPVREMLLGLGDEFLYYECSRCGCLQIDQPPADMTRYYSPAYLRPFRIMPADSAPKRSLSYLVDRCTLGRRWPLVRRLPRTRHSAVLRTVAEANLTSRSKVLDVGCGSGELLRRLRDLGIGRLVGVDPYLSEEVEERRLSMSRRTIHGLARDERFDLILFNHSLEHIPDQADTLARASELLSAGGLCLVRMPLKTECIWNLYGVNWVQIDAPRHFAIHTLESFRQLTDRVGLVIRDWFCDSTDMQFWGSEQYKRGIPLQAENSYGVDPSRGIFTAREIRAFREYTRRLNKAGQGDQASFCLVRSGSCRPESCG